MARICATSWSLIVEASPWPSWKKLACLVLFALWAVLLGIGTSAIGFRFSRFLPAFALVFVVSLVLYFIGQWDQASHYNLEPPLVALALGLLISNTVGAPADVIQVPRLSVGRVK